MFLSLSPQSMFAILKVPADPIPVTILFETLPSFQMMPEYKADFIAFATLLARRFILLSAFNIDLLTV